MGVTGPVVRQQFIQWLIICTSLLQSPSGFSDCTEVLKKVDSIAPWSLHEKNLKLSANDLFPPDYLKEVESQLGPWNIDVIHRPERGFVQIVGTVRSRPFVRVKLIQDPKREHALIVDELNLQDPLNNADPAQLNPDQNGKGLPPQVFRHIKEQLFKIAKAGSYEEIRTNSQQHFSVVMLYKRFVGMEPATEEAKRLLEQLEGLYSFARKELPEPLRPRDVEEFTRWLGTAGEDPVGLSEKRIQVLQKFLEEGVADPSFTLLHNKKGQMVGVLFNDHESSLGKIVFFDYSQGKPQILNWYGLAISHQLELVKKL